MWALASMKALRRAAPGGFCWACLKKVCGMTPAAWWMGLLRRPRRRPCRRPRETGGHVCRHWASSDASCTTTSCPGCGCGGRPRLSGWRIRSDQIDSPENTPDAYACVPCLYATQAPRRCIGNPRSRLTAKLVHGTPPPFPSEPADARRRKPGTRTGLLRQVAGHEAELLAGSAAGRRGFVHGLRGPASTWITSDPPGAMVFRNGTPIGPTPVDDQFVYYGNYHFTLVKDGYETLQADQDIPAPWYEYPPLDFVNEVLNPFKLHDVQAFHFQMRKAEPPNKEDLRRRGNGTAEPRQGPDPPGRIVSARTSTAPAGAADPIDARETIAQPRNRPARIVSVGRTTRAHDSGVFPMQKIQPPLKPFHLPSAFFIANRPPTGDDCLVEKIATTTRRKRTRRSQGHSPRGGTMKRFDHLLLFFFVSFGRIFRPCQGGGRRPVEDFPHSLRLRGRLGSVRLLKGAENVTLTTVEGGGVTHGARATA